MKGHFSYAAGLGIVLLSAFALLAPFQSAEAAFGISPPFMNAVHLVPGAKYAQTIYLVQDQPNQDLPISAKIDVPDAIRSWISIDQGLNFVIPKGVRQFPVQISVNVPKDASLAVYNGHVTFVSSPAQAGQVTIALGAEVIVNITVGNDIYRHIEVPVVRPLDIEEGWNPRVYVKFDNQGNVPEHFDAATFELSDQFGAVRLAYTQKRDGFPDIPPFTVKEFTVEFPIDFHIGLGQYWATVNFYQDDKVIAGQKTVFTALKRGSLSSPTAQLLQWMSQNWMYLMGGLVVLIIIYGLFRRRRHRRAS